MSEPTITPKMFPLVRYSCGCVGFSPDEEGKALLITDCTQDIHGYDDLRLFVRDMEGKEWATVDAETRQRYYKEIKDLLWAGYRWQELKDNLSR